MVNLVNERVEMRIVGIRESPLEAIGANIPPYLCYFSAMQSSGVVLKRKIEANYAFFLSLTP